MPKTPKPVEVPFEEAVEKLEELVSRMESGDLPLEGMLATYEEGMRLVALCSEKLAAAEKKIELLTRDKLGNLARSDFPENPAENGAPEDDEEFSF